MSAVVGAGSAGSNGAALSPALVSTSQQAPAGAAHRVEDSERERACWAAPASHVRVSSENAAVPCVCPQIANSTCRPPGRACGNTWRVAVRRAIRPGQGLDGAAARGHPQQAGPERRGVDDRVVLVPRPALRVRGVDEADGRAAGDLGLLQLSLREERDPPAVWREERFLARRSNLGTRRASNEFTIAQIELRVVVALPRDVRHRLGRRA